MKWRSPMPVLAVVAVVALAVAACTRSTGNQKETTAATFGTATPSPPGGAPTTLPPGGTTDDRARPVMDLTAAAGVLGIAEEALRAALGDSNRTQPDLAAAATQLGVSEESLRQALGFPQGAPPSGGTAPARPQTPSDIRTQS